MKFGKNCVKVKVNQLQTARMNRSTLDTGGKFLKLKKISNDRKLFIY